MTQEKGFFFADKPNEDEDKEAGLDNFAVRMGRKDFVTEIGTEVKDDGNPDVARVFEIKPIHDEDEADHARHEVDAVLPAFSDEVRLVVTFDAGKREVPEKPIGEEDEVGSEEAEAGEQHVGTVAVPGKFFEQGREGKQQPRREEGTGEAGVTGDAELLGAVTEGKRDKLGEDKGDGADKHGGEQVAQTDATQAEAGFEVGEQYRFLQEEPRGNSGWCSQADDTEGALQGGVGIKTGGMADIARCQPADARNEEGPEVEEAGAVVGIKIVHRGYFLIVSSAELYGVYG